MAMKVTAETFRGYGKVGSLQAQTAVECRFAQEVETVLTVHAHAVLTGADASNGEIRYYGKVHFSIVYEDAEKHICRAEKGVEWASSVKDEAVFPALTVRAEVAVENVSVRREGASVYATALLGADLSLYGEQSFEYLSGGDLVCKREPVKALVAHLCGGVSEAEDEFETEPLQDILQHTSSVCVSEVACETGVVRVEGDISLGVLALRGEGAPVSFERLVPFRIEIPCESASVGCGAEAAVTVVDVSLKAEEEEGKCRILAEFTLRAEGCVYEEVALDGVVDAFSTVCEVELTYHEANFSGAGEKSRITERIAGRAALSGPINFSDTLQAVTLQRAEAEIVSSADGYRAEGVALATLLIRNAEGEHRGVEMSLPFSIPVGRENSTVSVTVCGMAARQKQEGEIDAEATVKLLLSETKKTAVRLVSAAAEGAAITPPDCAISVYIPNAGDGLWELSKRLKKTPEEVEASNPDLQFPVKEGQRIIIYRKKQTA